MIIPLIMLVVLVVLGVLLRAIVAPLILIATVVLSYGAALGLSALIFDWALGVEATDSSFPLFVFVFLVALGIDYNIFLMTRVREEAFDHGTRRAALVGLAATGGVITSAGLVLAATFAVLATLPLTFATQLGIAVALGRAARHDRRALGARHRAHPRRRPVDVVAQHAGAPSRRARAAGRSRPRTCTCRFPGARAASRGQPFGRSFPRPSRTLTDTSIGVPSKPHCSRIFRSRNRR